MSHDTWIHRAVRPVARSLARTRVTPNQVTTLRPVAGLVAAAAFAEGSETGRAWGAGIFLLAMFLDRADGELARLSGRISSRATLTISFAMGFLTRSRSQGSGSACAPGSSMVGRRSWALPQVSRLPRPFG